jgi:hypothetical protein
LLIIGPNPFFHSPAQTTAHSPELIFHIMKSRDQTSVLLSVVWNHILDFQEMFYQSRLKAMVIILVKHLWAKYKIRSLLRYSKASTQAVLMSTDLVVMQFLNSYTCNTPILNRSFEDARFLILWFPFFITVSSRVLTRSV